MNFSFRIAKRYFFSKATTNAINIISGISVLGIAIGTAALIVILSVFNGFGDLITGMFGYFNPDIKIEIARGKFFEENPEQTLAILELPNVEYLSRTVEEIAFFEYDKNQVYGVIKGVDEIYPYINDIDSTIIEGHYYLTPDQLNYAVLGAGIRNQLGVDLDNDFQQLQIYMPKRGRVSNFENPFKQKNVKPIAAFSIQQDFDEKYVLTDLEFGQNLIDVKGQLSSYELKLSDVSRTDETKAQISKILGTDFKVMSKYEQDAGFLRIMNIEKWISYAIGILTFLLVAFNIVGALWMIVLEKKNDIGVFKSMGATDRQLSNIFIYEGLLLCLVGSAIGVVLALVIYYVQVNYVIVATPNGFAYPISLKITDFILILITVIGVSMLASIPAAQKAKHIGAVIKAD